LIERWKPEPPVSSVSFFPALAQKKTPGTREGLPVLSGGEKGNWKFSMFAGRFNPRENRRGPALQHHRRVETSG
jgi:hypothetical protein